MAAWRVWCIVAGVAVFGGAAEGRPSETGTPTRIAAPADPPLPPPRPDRPVAPAEPESGAPEDGAAPAGAAPPEERANLPEAEACRERLVRLGVRFETRPPLREGRCGATDPLLVTRLAEEVAVEPGATMTCPVAEALARWAADVLKPESGRHFSARPAKLLIGTSYECRDQRSGGKLSEHAFANGVDVMGFAFAGRPDLPVAAQAGGTPEGAFLAAVRKGACPYFTTVLGPGSDAAHADHLHLDLRARRGDYRICQ